MSKPICKSGLVIFLLVISSAYLYAQLKLEENNPEEIPHFSKSRYHFPGQVKPLVQFHLPVQAIPVMFRTCELPVFCRVELALEKSVSFPVKFRLGSVDYVDWLEGKSREKIIEGF